MYFDPFMVHRIGLWAVTAGTILVAIGLLGILLREDKAGAQAASGGKEAASKEP